MNCPPLHRTTSVGSGDADDEMRKHGDTVHQDHHHRTMARGEKWNSWKDNLARVTNGGMKVATLVTGTMEANSHWRERMTDSHYCWASERRLEMRLLRRRQLQQMLHRADWQTSN